jgi:hypothetical protein
LKDAKYIFAHGIAYSNGEILKSMHEFGDVILVISDSNFPSPITTNTDTSDPIKIEMPKVLSCRCGVLGRHIVFFCEITKQIKRFNIIICPTAQSKFIRFLH